MHCFCLLADVLTRAIFLIPWHLSESFRSSPWSSHPAGGRQVRVACIKVSVGANYLDCPDPFLLVGILGLEGDPVFFSLSVPR